MNFFPYHDQDMNYIRRERSPKRGTPCKRNAVFAVREFRDRVVCAIIRINRKNDYLSVSLILTLFFTSLVSFHVISTCAVFCRRSTSDHSQKTFDFQWLTRAAISPKFVVLHALASFYWRFWFVDIAFVVTQMSVQFSSKKTSSSVIQMLTLRKFVGTLFFCLDTNRFFPAVWKISLRSHWLMAAD